MELKKLPVTVIGLGLMGGSFALALKKRRIAGMVTGYDLDPLACQQAIAIGAIDRASDSIEDALANSDLIVLATPVGAILSHLNMIEKTVLSPCSVMDLGSTKKAICDKMDTLPPHIDAVGCHPMCGGFAPGIQNASADLFENKIFVICPSQHKTTDSEGIAFQIAKAIGSIPVKMDAAVHDQRVGTVSHMPYFMSVLMMQIAMQQMKNDPDLLNVAAGGFKMVTSLSAGSVEMWADIFLTNRQNMSHLLQEAKSFIEQWQTSINQSDEKSIKQRLSEIRRGRLKIEETNGKE